MLQTIGKIINISDRLMGLSILAFGNSVDDFIADVSLAKQGFGTMALTGAFCSPMFQLLFGLGCGLIIQTSYLKNNSIRGKDLDINGFVTIIVVFSGLLLGLIFSVSVSIYKHYTIPGKYRFVLYGLYVLVMLTVVLLEMHVIKL